MKNIEFHDLETYHSLLSSFSKKHNDIQHNSIGGFSNTFSIITK
jgi:hypothetical protein